MMSKFPTLLSDVIRKKTHFSEYAKRIVNIDYKTLI